MAGLGAAGETLLDPVTTHSKTLWPSPVREAAMTVRLRARKLQKDMQQEHEAATSEIEKEAIVTLQVELNELRCAHHQKLTEAEQEQQASAYLLQQQLHQEISSQPERAARIEAILSEDVNEHLWRLAEDQRRYQACEAARHENTLQQVIANAEDAERAYIRLRGALVRAHAEAERLHAEAMEEQAEQVRELTALCGSHASFLSFPEAS